MRGGGERGLKSIPGKPHRALLDYRRREGEKWALRSEREAQAPGEGAFYPE